MPRSGKAKKSTPNRARPSTVGATASFPSPDVPDAAAASTHPLTFGAVLRRLVKSIRAQTWPASTLAESRQVPRTALTPEETITECAAIGGNVAGPVGPVLPRWWLDPDEKPPNT